MAKEVSSVARYQARINGESGDYIKGIGFLVTQVKCVYIIRCTKNNAVYIGQTKQDMTRQLQHFTRLRTNTHYNYKLQSDYNLYGMEHFYFKIVTIEKAKLKREWIESDYIIKAKERESNGGVKVYNIEIPKRKNIGYEFKNEDNE